MPSDIRDTFADDRTDANPATLVDWSQYPTIKAVFDSPTGEDLLTALSVEAQAVQAQAPDACQRVENATWEMMSQTPGRSAGDQAQAADKIGQAAQQLEQERTALLQTINQWGTARPRSS